MPTSPTRWLYKSQRNHVITPPLLADIFSALILIKSVIQPNILTYILIRIKRAHEGLDPTQYAILITYNLDRIVIAEFSNIQSNGTIYIIML